MRKTVLFIAVISLFLIINSCGGGGGGKTSSSGLSPVTLTAKFITSTDMKAAASTIANIHYIVTGPGMKMMEGTAPVTGNLVEFKLNVPNGKRRFFRLTAVNSSSHILYGGATYQDLNGKPVTVDINLKNPIAGKWGFVDFGRDIDSWETKAGRIAFRTDGSMTIFTYYHNDGGYITSKTEDFRYTVVLNSDGSTSLMLVRTDGNTAQVPFVLSDDGNTLFFDGTQSITDQKIFIAGRMDPANNYTNADLSGEYYAIGYEHNLNPVAPPNGNGGYMAISSLETFNGNGNFTYYGKANSDGIIWNDSDNSSRNYSVNPDGFFSVLRDDNTIQGAGGIGINRKGALAAPVTPDKWGFYFSMKKGDRTYSTADFEGTWAVTIFGDDNNTNFQSAFGTGACDSRGNCTFNFKERDSNGSLSNKSKSIAVSVSPDGSFGQSDVNSPLSPPYAGAIGNDGNTFILNPSFGPAPDGNTFNNNRTIIIGVRYSGFPPQMKTTDISGTWLLYTTPQGGVESEPYPFYISQRDSYVDYQLWQHEWAMGVGGIINGNNLELSGQTTYYGDTRDPANGIGFELVTNIFFSGTAVIGDTLTGNYSYTGVYNEKGTWRAVRGAGKKAKGWVRIANFGNGTSVLDFYLWDLIPEGVTITAATVTGPNIPPLILYSINPQNEFESWYSSSSLGSAPPVPGDVYTFTVNYNDGTSETTTATVRNTFVETPMPLSPLDGATVNTLTPTFSWKAPSCGCQGYYRVWIVDSNGNDVWSIYLPGNKISVVYNSDNKGAALQSGKTYEWRLIAYDKPINGGPDNYFWVGNTFTVQ